MRSWTIWVFLFHFRLFLVFLLKSMHTCVRLCVFVLWQMLSDSSWWNFISKILTIFFFCFSICVSIYIYAWPSVFLFVCVCIVYYPLLFGNNNTKYICIVSLTIITTILITMYSNGDYFRNLLKNNNNNNENNNNNNN